jgi:hypothetical protein
MTFTKLKVEEKVVSGGGERGKREYTKGLQGNDR